MIDSNQGQVGCLVICHVRELAYQICEEFKRFSRFLPAIRTSVLFGGVPVSVDRKKLKEESPHIVVGTPGRIKHLLKEGVLNLLSLKHFILDECDRLLESSDMRKDVQDIFMATPHDKQVMMFSATLDKEIKDTCKKFMHNPLEVLVDDSSKLVLTGIQQYFCSLQESQKNRKLVDLLDALKFNQVIIFAKSVERVQMLHRILKECNFPVIFVHGKLDQEDRIARYTTFKQFGSRILVATSLLGRGVDFPKVNIVFNYDMPEDGDEYLHKVGRTARFGTKGLAISFVVKETDMVVITDVSKRFVVNIPELPDTIEPSTYMSS